MNGMILATYSLSGDGAWHVLAALALTAALAAFGWWQYRLEFHGGHESQLRRKWLPLLRTVIIVLLGWLLWQPVLSRLEARPNMPRLLVLVDTSPSMATVEDFGGLSRKLDMLTKLEGKGPEGRNGSGSALAERVGRLAATLATGSSHWQQVLEDLDQGMPLPATLTTDLESLRQRVSEQTGGLPEVSPGALKLEAEDPLRESLAKLGALRSNVLAAAEGLVTDADLAGREAVQHPQLLRDFAQHLQAAAATAAALRQAAYEVQEQLDERLIPEAVRKAVEERRLTRSDWAKLAVDDLRDQYGHRMELNVVEAAGLPAAMAAAFSAHLQRPVWQAVMISDGSSEAGSQLPPGVPVNGVVIGRDGVEPPDLAVIGLELPPLAVAGEPVDARVLVKNGLPETVRAGLEIRSGESVLGSTEVVPTEQPTVLTVPVTLTAGHQVVAAVAQAARGDSFAGNESQPGSIDVLEHPARAVLVGSGLRDDVAAMRQVLSHLPGVETATLLAAPGIEEFKIGDEADNFPDSAKGWEGIDLVVLVGPVPEMFQTDDGKKALAGLKEALANGLHAYIREPADGNGWGAALGFGSKAAAAANLAPVAGAWHGFYRLGLGRESSLRALTKLGPVAGARSWAGTGSPLLLAGGEPVVAEVAQGKGLVLLDGLGGLHALRAAGNVPVANRLMAGLLATALRSTDADAAASDPAPVEQAYDLMARAKPLSALAERSGGAWVPLEDLDRLGLKPDEARPPAQLLAASWQLWHGWWPLPLLLVLVTAEYLLRRKAGRVM